MVSFLFQERSVLHVWKIFFQKLVKHSSKVFIQKSHNECLNKPKVTRMLILLSALCLYTWLTDAWGLSHAFLGI